MCEEEGHIRPAAEVDHIQKHDGDPALFWNWDNLQGLCRYHHRSVKSRMERSGNYGCDTDGIPRNPAHHWR
jgi:5-methylcytosine-specific restriction endonuclease McrA